MNGAYGKRRSEYVKQSKGIWSERSGLMVDRVQFKALSHLAWPNRSRVVRVTGRCRMFEYQAGEVTAAVGDDNRVLPWRTVVGSVCTRGCCRVRTNTSGAS